MMSLLHKLLLLFVILGVTSEAAQATPPTYAPYGAWRGRIRYVEGPWRTRSTIHWGNGVTPTGGQVLISGLNVAGDVLTSENFWSNAIGRDSEKEAASNEALRENIQTVVATNSSMRTDLNATLKKLGLEPSKPVAVVTPAGPTQLPLDLEQLLTDHRESVKQLRDINLTLKPQLAVALRDGQLILDEAENLQPKLNEEQLAVMQQWNDFFSSVAKAYKKPLAPSAPEAGQKPDVLAYYTKSTQLLATCQLFNDLVTKATDAGEKLLPSIDSKEITDGVDLAKRMSAATTKWEAIPPKTTDVFKNYQQVFGDPSDATPPPPVVDPIP